MEGKGNLPLGGQSHIIHTRPSCAAWQVGLQSVLFGGGVFGEAYFNDSFSLRLTLSPNVRDCRRSSHQLGLSSLLSVSPPGLTVAAYRLQGFKSSRGTTRVFGIGRTPQSSVFSVFSVPG